MAIETGMNLRNLHWEDALDDGSLTLRAEHLLLRLPSSAVPAHNCIFAPNLINKLADSMGPFLSKDEGDFQSNLRHKVEDILADTQHLKFRPQISEAMESEWIRLENWLRVDHAPQTTQPPQVMDQPRPNSSNSMRPSVA